MNCAECGTLNGPTQLLCVGCGNDIRKEPAGRGGAGGSQSLMGALDSGRDAREGLRELYAAAVGPRNRDHYLAKFALFDHERRTSAGWHWPAFFLTFYWLLHRKMWGLAALYFFLPYLLVFPAVVFAQSMPSALPIAYAVYLAAIFVVPPLFADAAYYRHCERIIEKARAVNRSQEGQLVLVAVKGGTSNIVLVLAFLVGIPMVLGVLAAIALPAYQDSTLRAKTTQALAYGRSAATAVGAFYERNQRVPASLSEARFDPPLPGALQDLQFDASRAVLTMVLAPGPLTGKLIRLVPATDLQGRVIWSCQAVEIAAKYLPPDCRR
jgi:type II secretory pathway pseudopilin PulG